MDSGSTLIVAREALLLVLILAGPMLAVALIIGAGIGLLQALTQVQEATLTFVPKLVAMGIVLLLSLPMMGRALSAFMGVIAQRMVDGG
jgi:flagellar biosynthetic protein FliQ